MYSTEQLLEMLEEKLKDYKRDSQALEDNANKSVNPSKYRETIEYKKRRDKIDAKIAYIESVISTVESKKNNLESIGSSILDKQVDKKRIAISTVTGERLAALQEKAGKIEEKQRKLMSIKYNHIKRRIEITAAIMSGLKNIDGQKSAFENKITEETQKRTNFQNAVNNWSSKGIFGKLKGIKLPEFAKTTLIRGYNIISSAKSGMLSLKLIALAGKKAILNEIGTRVESSEEQRKNKGAVR